jgi:hypothetical protein
VTFSPSTSACSGQHLRRRHAVLRRRGVVDAHLDLRRQHLLLDLQVGDAGDGGQLRAQGIGLAAQGVQVLAKDLDGDLRAHARQHVVDAVRDGLADLQRSRQVDQPRLRMSALISSMLRVSSAVGLRPTSSSLTCTPSACSSSSARPLRRPTCVTSGTCLTSTSAWRARPMTPSR